MQVNEELEIVLVDPPQREPLRFDPLRIV